MEKLGLIVIIFSLTPLCLLATDLNWNRVEEVHEGNETNQAPKTNKYLIELVGTYADNEKYFEINMTANGELDNVDLNETSSANETANLTTIDFGENIEASPMNETKVTPENIIKLTETSTTNTVKPLERSRAIETQKIHKRPLVKILNFDKNKHDPIAPIDTNVAYNVDESYIKMLNKWLGKSYKKMANFKDTNFDEIKELGYDNYDQRDEKGNYWSKKQIKRYEKPNVRPKFYPVLEDTDNSMDDFYTAYNKHTRRTRPYILDRKNSDRNNPFGYQTSLNYKNQNIYGMNYFKPSTFWPHTPYHNEDLMQYNYVEPTSFLDEMLSPNQQYKKPTYINSYRRMPQQEFVRDEQEQVYPYRPMRYRNRHFYQTSNSNPSYAYPIYRHNDQNFLKSYLHSPYPKSHTSHYDGEQNLGPYENFLENPQESLVHDSHYQRNILPKAFYKNRFNNFGDYDSISEYRQAMIAPPKPYFDSDTYITPFTSRNNEKPRNDAYKVSAFRGFEGNYEPYQPRELSRFLRTLLGESDHYNNDEDTFLYD